MVIVKRKVIKDRKGKLTISPRFPHQGCYFYFIPNEYLQEDSLILIEKDKEYFFKFGKPKDTGNVDKRGKHIFICAAIPVVAAEGDNDA